MISLSPYLYGTIWFQPVHLRKKWTNWGGFKLSYLIHEDSTEARSENELFEGTLKIDWLSFSLINALTTLVNF